jgi:hypothetical protein
LEIDLTGIFLPRGQPSRQFSANRMPQPSYLKENTLSTKLAALSKDG